VSKFTEKEVILYELLVTVISKINFDKSIIKEKANVSFKVSLNINDETPEPKVTKLLTFVIYKCLQKVRAFVPSLTFQPCLMFASLVMSLTYNV
jgi:hypothetical protein